MFEDGYIILPRSILSEYFWTTKSPFTCKVFLHLVLQAAHKDYQHPSGIDLKRGQFYTSSREIAKYLGISRNTIRHILTRLEHAHQVTQQHAHKGIVITICDYDRFRYFVERNTPNNTPNTSSPVAQMALRCGTPFAPPLYKINNKETIVGSSEKSEVQNDEIPWLRDAYPFPNREGLKQHLIARNYTEHEATLWMERFYIEYTGKKEALV